MSALSARLRKVEFALGQTPARMVVFEGRHDMTPGARDMLLGEVVPSVTGEDMLVHLRRFDPEVDGVARPARILHVLPLGQ